MSWIANSPELLQSSNCILTIAIISGVELMKGLSLAAFLLALQTFVPCARCGAIEAVDQENVATYFPGLSRGFVINSSLSVAQIVTSGIGGKLTRVEIGVTRNFDTDIPLIIDIAKVVDGSPDFSEDARLATQYLLSTDILFASSIEATFTPVDFSAASLFFESGEPFAIVARSNSPDPYNYGWVRNVGGSTYPGGNAYQKFLEEGVVYSFRTDNQFRTFVEPIPEPACMPLAITASFALAASRSAMNKR